MFDQKNPFDRRISFLTTWPAVLSSVSLLFFYIVCVVECFCIHIFDFKPFIVSRQPFDNIQLYGSVLIWMPLHFGVLNNVLCLVECKCIYPVIVCLFYQ